MMAADRPLGPSALPGSPEPLCPERFLHHRAVRSRIATVTVAPHPARQPSLALSLQAA